jgi:hypothetical protein
VVNFDVEVPECVEQHRVSLEDEDEANLLDHLKDAVTFIDHAVGSDGKVCARHAHLFVYDKSVS